MYNLTAPQQLYVLITMHICIHVYMYTIYIYNANVCMCVHVYAYCMHIYACIYVCTYAAPISDPQQFLILTNAWGGKVLLFQA